jgi:hypothetical protein
MRVFAIRPKLNTNSECVYLPIHILRVCDKTEAARVPRWRPETFVGEHERDGLQHLYVHGRGRKPRNSLHLPGETWGRWASVSRVRGR